MNAANYVVQYVGCFFEVLLSAYFFLPLRKEGFLLRFVLPSSR